MQEMDYRRLLLTSFFGGAMISELASHALLAVGDLAPCEVMTLRTA